MVNFLSQVIFVSLLLLGMLMYADEVERKEKAKIICDKTYKKKHNNNNNKIDTCMLNLLNLILARLLMTALLTLRLGIRRVNKRGMGAKGKRRTWTSDHPFN